MNEIKLRRITELVELPIKEGDGDERDHTLYERQDDGSIKRVFLQVNDEAKRIYIDHAPEKAEAIEDIIADETERYDALQTHDDEATEYEDYKNQKAFFAKYELYMEIIG